MSISRKHQADNLTQVAHDIIQYVLAIKKSPQEKQAHRDELVNIFNEAKAKYENPQHLYVNVLAWIEQNIIYPFSRRRYQELIAAQGAVLSSEQNERMLILDVFCKVLRMGRCESTSFNSFLLDLLIEKTNKYYPLNEDPEIQELGWGHVSGALLTCHEKIREKFVEKAEHVIADYEHQVAEHEQNQKKTTSIEIKQLATSDAFRDELSRKLTGMSLLTKALQGGARVNKIPEKISVIEEYDSASYKPVDFAAMHQQLSVVWKDASSKLDLPDDKIIPDWLFSEADAKDVPKKLSETYPNRLKAIGDFFGNRPQPALAQQEAKIKPGM